MRRLAQSGPDQSSHVNISVADSRVNNKIAGRKVFQIFGDLFSKSLGELFSIQRLPEIILEFAPIQDQTAFAQLRKAAERKNGKHRGGFE